MVPLSAAQGHNRRRRWAHFMGKTSTKDSNGNTIVYRTRARPNASLLWSTPFPLVRHRYLQSARLSGATSWWRQIAGRFSTTEEAGLINLLHRTSHTITNKCYRNSAGNQQPSIKRLMGRTRLRLKMDCLHRCLHTCFWSYTMRRAIIVLLRFCLGLRMIWMVDLVFQRTKHHHQRRVFARTFSQYYHIVEFHLLPRHRDILR